MSDSIRFSLVRDEKVVADGVLFRDGAAVLRWRVFVRVMVYATTFGVSGLTCTNS